MDTIVVCDFDNTLYDIRHLIDIVNDFFNLDLDYLDITKFDISHLLKTSPKNLELDDDFIFWDSDEFLGHTTRKEILNTKLIEELQDVDVPIYILTDRTDKTKSILEDIFNDLGLRVTLIFNDLSSKYEKIKELGLHKNNIIFLEDRPKHVKEFIERHEYKSVIYCPKCKYNENITKEYNLKTLSDLDLLSDINYLTDY